MDFTNVVFFHYYSQALEIGLGIKKPSNEEFKVVAEDVKKWIDSIHESKGDNDE